MLECSDGCTIVCWGWGRGDSGECRQGTVEHMHPDFGKNVYNFDLLHCYLYVVSVFSKTRG